jgi:hypothetical protein
MSVAPLHFEQVAVTLLYIGYSNYGIKLNRAIWLQHSAMIVVTLVKHNLNYGTVLKASMNLLEISVVSLASYTRLRWWPSHSNVVGELW